MITGVHFDRTILQLVIDATVFALAVAAVGGVGLLLETLVHRACKALAELRGAFAWLFRLFLPTFLLVDLLMLLAYRFEEVFRQFGMVA